MDNITFYFSGHCFEYEVRNDLRIFDLNIKYDIKELEESKNNVGLGLVSILEEKENEIISKAVLYKNNKILFTAQYSNNEISLECENHKKLKKTLVVKAIHNVFKNYYNINPEYGILTGVRVVKILITALEQGKTKSETNEILRNTYEVEKEKIQLLWDILSVEEKYINREKNKKNYNLYVGIPFCPSKCSYCSFVSFINCKDDKINEYIETLTIEINETIKMALEKKLELNTVYIGGGTPSVLNEKQIDAIFESINKYYDLSKIKEVTFEAGRPDTLTKEKLICLKKNGVNRISINPQTMNDETLHSIGRNHTTADIINKYEMARKIGFNSINMDVIIGLPGENEEDVKNTIEKLVKLRPENITVHALAYKRKSELTRESCELKKDYILIEKMHEVIKNKCIETGYMPYYMYRQKNIKGNSENIGFTLPNKESIYNMVIIEELETILACGLGASSKIKNDIGRHMPLLNFKSLEEYKARINEIIEKKKKLLNLER